MAMLPMSHQTGVPTQGESLPKGQPCVGSWRSVPAQTGTNIKKEFLPEPTDVAGRHAVKPQESLPPLLKVTPFAAFCRDAPPSPMLSFSRGRGSSDDHSCPQFHLELLEEEDEQHQSSAKPPVGNLIEETWATALSFCAEVAAIPPLTCVSREFKDLLFRPETWFGCKVGVPFGSLRKLAPVLCRWLGAWRHAAKLVMPSSNQMMAEVRRLAPALELEIAWRFDFAAKGTGLEVIRGGAAVRRIDEEDVVVLGDAPLIITDDRTAYVEVLLEKLDDVPAGDGLNDFGIGVTACDPYELEELGAVASEVPRSWVVDFAASVVCLNVDNVLEAKGYGAGADGLVEGDRVGVRVTPTGDALEVFINGELRDSLKIPEDNPVPVGAKLFPVFDLYGRALQISRTHAEGPYQ